MSSQYLLETVDRPTSASFTLVKTRPMWKYSIELQPQLYDPPEKALARAKPKYSQLYFAIDHGTYILPFVRKSIIVAYKELLLCHIVPTYLKQFVGKII